MENTFPCRWQFSLSLSEAVRDAVSEGVATKMDIAGLKADHARLEGKIDVLVSYNKISIVFSGTVVAAVVAAVVAHIFA